MFSLNHQPRNFWLMKVAGHAHGRKKLGQFSILCLETALADFS